MGEQEEVNHGDTAEGKSFGVAQGKGSTSFLATSILIAALIISGALIYSFGPRPGGDLLPEEEITQTAPPIEGEPLLGDLEAPLTLIEYSDYQCPFCGKFFSETEQLIRENYIQTGKVNFVYKDLAFLGPESVAAAEAAQCAFEQGKFWEYHDALFREEIADGVEHNGNLNEKLFTQLAQEVGLDETVFVECLSSHRQLSEVQNDVEEAQTYLSRVSTPSIFVGTELLQGALPYANFSALIDQQLSAQQ